MKNGIELKCTNCMATTWQKHINLVETIAKFTTIDRSKQLTSWVFQSKKVRNSNRSYFDLVKQETCILTLTYIFRSEKMRTFIVISFLIASVLSHKDRHDLPYDGAILRRNGDLIPGKHYQFHWPWLIYKNLIAYSIFRGNFMHLDENI